MKNKNNKHKQGRIRYYTFSTRLQYNERNKFLEHCRIIGLTPSEVLREVIKDKIRFLKHTQKSSKERK